MTTSPDRRAPPPRLEARKRAIAAKGLLLLASALDSAFGGTPPVPAADAATTSPTSSPRSPATSAA